MNSSTWVIYFLKFCLLLSALSSVEGLIKCYNCNGEEPCSKSSTCDGIACYNAKVYGDGTFRRGCVPTLYNNTVDPSFDFRGDCKETSGERICKCTTNLCNGAAVSSSSTLLYILPSSLMLLLYHLW